MHPHPFRTAAPRHRRSTAAGRTARILAGAAALALLNAGAAPGPTPAPPNIIVILADDLGYGDLGCYGGARQRTPRLDRLAAEGIRFTDFSMSASVCSPSRASLLTGCYHKRVGVNNVLFPLSRSGLHPDEPTLGDVLRQAGYATRFFGKWHVGDQRPLLPTNQGFDDFYGIPYSHDMHSLVRVRREPGELRPVHLRVLPLVRGDQVERLVRRVKPLMSAYHAEIDRFVGDCAREQTPFFVFLAYHAVHLPNEPPDTFAGTSSNESYGDWIQAMDFHVGFLLDRLAEEGIDQNTLVVFTSDNGPSARNRGSAGPFRGHKHTLWEGGRRVPLLARWPDRIPPGQVCDAMAGSMDLLPTLASIAGASLDSLPPIDGVDLSPLLFGSPPPTPLRTTFAYYAAAELKAVREGPWKLHLRTRKRPTRLLYHLASDPAEEQNVVSANPEVVQRLLDLAAGFRAELGDGRREGRGQRDPARITHLQPLFDALSHPRESDDAGPPDDAGDPAAPPADDLSTPP